MKRYELPVRTDLKQRELADLRSLPGFEKARSWEQVAADRARVMKQQNWKKKGNGHPECKGMTA